MDDDQTPRILVVNDDNRIFRDLETSGEIIKRVVRPDRDWVIFATADPFERGELWNVIEEQKLYARTVVVVPLAALRSQGHNIRQDMAVETKAYNLWVHVRSSPKLKNLMNCQHVLVRDRYGVFHLNREKPDKVDYFLRPFEAGPESNPQQYGVMSGHEKILIASIVKEVLSDALLSNGSSDYKITCDNLSECIRHGICKGLRLWTRHFDTGFSYGLDHSTFPGKYLKLRRDDEEPHPFDHLFKIELTNEPPRGLENDKKDEKRPVAWVQFPFSLATGITGKTEEKEKAWSRVEWFRSEVERIAKEKKQYFDFKDCLAAVVTHGLKNTIERYKDNEYNTLPCSVARYGKLEVVDKEEIDWFLDIYNIIVKYLGDDSWKTPLSLAVFGPPGTGKSFVVKEILRAARSSTKRAGSGDPLEYNLAQFTKPENLTTAFHQVQDRALSEEVPLILFDEFDSHFGIDYGWLKYFLAPMQDGKFKAADTEASYRVGRAIFVFAGGIAKTFEEFKGNVAKDKKAKGPDFISRLRGYINIKSINKEVWEKSVNDLLAFRRAIVLRSILEQKVKHVFDEPSQIARINRRLINALLWVSSYEHGIRSMEAIVQMAVPERGELQVASLPSPDQLGMHVNVEEFLELMEI